MTLKEIKSVSMAPGLEGLGGCSWEFCPDKFADLLVKEISMWANGEDFLFDEEELRVALGMSTNSEEQERKLYEELHKKYGNVEPWEDRMGGQVTQEEIYRSKNGGW